MDSDELDTLWRSQDQMAPISIDPNLLIREVRRNANYFQTMIFWRDVREIGVAIPLIALFIYWGIKDNDWTMYVMALSCLWVAVFIFTDRIRHKRSLKAYDQSLIGNTQRALEQVKHQIWLLKNVFWWYLMPPSLGILLVLGHAIWELRDVNHWLVLLAVAGTIILCVIGFAGVYWLNQNEVNKKLRPRQSELQALLDKLTSNGE